MSAQQLRNKLAEIRAFRGRGDPGLVFVENYFEIADRFRGLAVNPATLLRCRHLDGLEIIHSSD